MRYVVKEGSDSGHCCFEASVMDTSMTYKLSSRAEYGVCVCECLDKDDAEQIARALNRLNE